MSTQACTQPALFMRWMQQYSLFTSSARLHQLHHHPAHKLLPNPGHFGVHAHSAVKNLLHIISGRCRQNTFGPIKFALVHIRLNDGYDRLALELHVGVKELCIEDGVHRASLGLCFLQAAH